jgi:hypothetical protein
VAYSAKARVQQGRTESETQYADQKTHKGPRRVASGAGMKAVNHHSPMVGKVGRGNKRTSTGYHGKNKRATY